MRGHFAVGDSQEEGGGKREERAVRGWRARARPRGDSAVRPMRREGMNHEMHETHEKAEIRREIPCRLEIKNPATH